MIARSTDFDALDDRWRHGAVLKRDVFSTIERGRFRADGSEIDAVLRRVDAVPWWTRPLARHFLRRETRALQIVAAAGPSVPLSINNVVTLPTRGVGNGVSIAYVVTRAADVQVRVEALNGRVIRRIAGGRAEAAGQQRLLWDGRAENGSLLPPGPYTVTLSARDDDGQTAQVRRVITLLQ